MTNRSAARTEFLTDILTTAVEGGINYWALVENYRPEQGTVTVCELEEFDEEDERFPAEARHAVTLDTIATGIGRLIEARKGHDPESYWHQFVIANRTNGEQGDYDADVADQILQAGILGSVVYG